MEYDFSKIKTEELRRMMKLCDNNNDTHCYSIECKNCPFDGSQDKNECTGHSEERQYKLFKSELNRREKMENKMPELESGMIVEFCTNPIDKMLYINDEWLMSLKNDGWADFKGSLTKKHVNKIYKCNHYIKGYSDCLDNLELVWSKKSDKDIKIEELERTIKKAQEQIQELKG